jgi:PAS domain S-box-containing protein
MARHSAKSAVANPVSPEGGLRRLLEAATRLLAQPDADALFDSILKIAAELIEADAYAVWRRPPGSSAWRILASAGLSANYPTKIERGAGFPLDGEPIVMNDVQHLPKQLQDRAALYEAEGICAMVAFPMELPPEGLSGTLVFYRRHAEPFTQEQIELGKMLAELAAGAIAAADRHEQQRLQGAENAALHSALQHSQQRLELAQYAAGAWSWEVDLETQTVQRSYPPQGQQSPVLDTPITTLGELFEHIHPDDRERAHSMFRQAMAGGSGEGEIEYRLVLNDGTVRWIYLRGRILSSEGQPRRMLGIAMDVTTRKQAEEELRTTQQERQQSMMLLTSFINSAPMGFALHDREMRFIDINPYLAALNGVPREQHYGRSVDEVIPGIAQTVSMLMRRVLETGEPVRAEVEGDTLDPNRRRYWMSNYFPVKNEAGVVAVGAAVTDITERKLAEEALRKAEKLAAVGRLSATIAHEINNPLEAVTNLLYLLRKESGLSAAGRQYLETAEHEVSRVAQIAKQTLGFYRDSGAAAISNLGELVDEVLLLYASRLRAKGIRVERRYSETAGALVFRGEIRQVMANLISNAIDAVEEDGQITIEIAGGERDQTPGVEIRVRDNGCGIAAQEVERIFEPFFTTKKELGTGLGLWVSREIVEKHGGTIRVQSRTGGDDHGTDFLVWLPREPVAG